MPKLPVRPFRKTDNVSILNAIRNEATPDYRRRIPEATQANLSETLQSLWDYPGHRNEFIHDFVNKIGRTVARNISFENPLAKFKIGALEYGESIEEYATGLLKAYQYDPSRDYLERDVFGQSVPEAKVVYHTRNRQNSYKVTINESELKRAFHTSDGLYTLINQVMGAATVSDNVDEFLLMTRLFREYYDAGGFYKVQVPDMTAPGVTKAEVEDFLIAVRSWAPTLGFVSSHYNAAHMPVAAPLDRLELFVTPLAQARMDVTALAAAFNIDRADVPSRTTVIPPEYMNIPGAQAVLTTRDFFMVADTYFDTDSIRNPAGRYTNHWLHHDQIVSASPFVPALLFTTEEGDSITVSETPVVDMTPITAYFRGREDEPTADAVRGDYVQIIGSAITDPEGGVNDQIRLDLTGAGSVQTRLDNNGTLFVGSDEPALELVVTATSLDDPDYTETLTLTVTGEIVVRDGLGVTVEPEPEPVEDPEP